MGGTAGISLNGAAEVLLEIPLRADGDAVLRVTLPTRKRGPVVDIRVFYRWPGAADHTPTKKGCSLTPEQASQVMEAIKLAVSPRPAGGSSDRADGIKAHGRRLDPATRERIAELRASGVSAADIATTVGVGLATVYRIAGSERGGSGAG